MYTTQIETHRPVLLRPLLAGRGRHVTSRCSVCWCSVCCCRDSRASSALPRAWRRPVDLALKHYRQLSCLSVLTRVSGATTSWQLGCQSLGCNRPVPCCAELAEIAENHQWETTVGEGSRRPGSRPGLRVWARVGALASHVCVTRLFWSPLCSTRHRDLTITKTHREASSRVQQTTAQHTTTPSHHHNTLFHRFHRAANLLRLPIPSHPSATQQASKHQ